MVEQLNYNNLTLMLVTITFGVESRDGDHAVDEFAATASYAERKLNLEHR